MTDQLLSPDFYFAGPSKSASTWIYQALSEHPEICMADDDPTNFFDVKFHKGFDWYRSQFDHYDGESVVGDESPGYFKSPFAPARIAKYTPDAKIMFCLRNPVDRAYSQWWHGRTWWHHGSFSMAINHHPTFDMWTLPGYYNQHLNRWEKYFSSDQIKILFFDDFKQDNEAFASEVYNFIGVDSDFLPSVAGEKVNQAREVAPDIFRTVPATIRSTIRKWIPNKIIEKFIEPVYFAFRPYYSQIEELFSSRDTYEEGMNTEMRKELEQIYANDIRKLEKRTGRDLNSWFKHIDLDTIPDTTIDETID